MVVNNLAESLRRYGIEAAEYKNPPAGREVFAITILNRQRHGHNKGVVTLNHGQARVQVFGSRKQRQASVTVKESERKITRLVKERTINEKSPSEDDVVKRLKGNFPIGMPADTVWTVEDVVIQRGKRVSATFPNESPIRYVWNCSGKVTASVENKSTNHFLIGMDETHHFISPLPKQATSVAMAHRILRGKVKAGTTRQGEWFFVPVSRKRSCELNKVATEKSGRLRPLRLGDSTHTAKTAITIGNNTYVRGFITDNRSGHHRSIFLTNWREVRHNKETQMQISPAQRDASAARRRMLSWD